MADKTQDSASKKSSGNGVRDLFDAFEQVARLYGDRAADLVRETDSVPLVRHYTQVVAEQIRQLGGVFDAARSSASDDTLRRVDELLRLTAAQQLASGANEAIAAVNSPAGLALSANPLLLIKKIIRRLAKALGINLPGLVDVILELIDELIGGQAEAVSPAAADQIHRGEIRFLEAQLHLERLIQLQERARREVDDNDH